MGYHRGCATGALLVGTTGSGNLHALALWLQAAASRALPSGACRVCWLLLLLLLLMILMLLLMMMGGL